MDSTTSAAKSVSSRISQILQPRYDSASPIWRSPSTRDDTISCFAALLCDLVETLQPSTDSETKKIFHPTASESMSDIDSKQAKDGSSALSVNGDVPQDLGSGGVDAAISVSVPPASHANEQESQAHERNRGKIHPATLGAKEQGNTESDQFPIFLSQLSTSASKMAKFMAKQDADTVNNAKDEHDRQSKDKLTVADIASRCINLLTGGGIASDSSKQFCSELYNVYIEFIGYKPTTMISRYEDDSEQNRTKSVELNESFFIRCMISSLKGVQFASTAYVEDISDFDFLWKWLMDCPSLEAFFTPNKNETLLRSENVDLSVVSKKRSSPDGDASSSQKDEISSLQDFSWVLSCLMKRFRQLRKPHLLSENEDTCSQALGRRDRVLKIASSMVIVMQPSIDLGECHRFTTTTKRRRLDNESTSESKTPEVSQSPPAEKKGSRTIDEGEAIAALSMMISGPENCEGSPRSVSLGSSNTLDHVLSTSQDLVTLMISAGNELLSHIPETNTYQTPFTHEELEREIADTMKAFISDFSAHLVLQQQPSSEIMSNSVRSCSDIAVKAGSNSLVGNPGDTKADCQMNSASEIPETTTHDSQSSEVSNSTEVKAEGESGAKPVGSDKVQPLSMEPDIKSYVETHQSRMDNLPFLKKWYGKVVSDLTAESGTTTAQKELSIISILGSFPYVDEMLFFDRDLLVLSLISTSTADLSSVGKVSESLALTCQYSKVPEINSEVVSVDPSPDIDDAPQSHLPSSKKWESDSMIMHDFDGTDLVTSSESHFLSSDNANMMSPRPVLTEAMELTEWTASILELETIKPSSRLLAYLDLSDTEPVAAKTSTAGSVIPRRGWRSVLIPAVNRATFRIKESIVQHDSSLETSGQCLCSETGEMLDDVHNSLLEPETSTSLPKHVTRLCKSLVALYYHALEAILSNETKRLRSSSHAQILHNEEYHRALLTVCYLCLLKVLGGDVGDKSELYSIVDVHSVLKLMECSPFLFLKVSEPFTRALQACDRRHESVGGEKHMFSLLNDPLPRLLQKHVRNSEIMIVDSLIWLEDNGIDGKCELSRLIDEVFEEENHEDESLGETAWPPKCLRNTLPGEKEDMEMDEDEYKMPFESRNPEYPYLNFLLQKMLIVWSYRISFLCHALKIPNEYPVTNQIWLKFRYLLRHHIHLFIDHHVDQLILCTIYSVCRIMKMEPTLSFSTITNEYMSLREEELGKNAAIRVIHHIKIPVKTDSMNAKGYGNVVQFYNDVYVPAVGKHLMVSRELKRAGAELGEIMASSGGDNEPTPQPQQLTNGFPHSHAGEEDSKKVARSDSNVVRVGSSSIYMKVPGHFQNSNKGKQSSETTEARWEVLSPKIRASYNFGEPSVKSLALVNKVAQSSNSLP